MSLLCLPLLLCPQDVAPATRPVAPDTPGAPESAPAALEVTPLANEGFLLAWGERRVLIDAFVREPYSIYAALPPDVEARMLAREAPFEHVDLALVSHQHRDHFQPTAALAFLAAHPETLLASSPQVLAPLRAGTGEALTARLLEFFPAPGETLILERAGLQVEFLHLSHGTGRFKDIQNLGHVVTLGPHRVAHVGDAAMVPANFAPYRLAERALDVALVPYWYYQDREGRRVLDQHLVARHQVACHVPPREVGQVRRFLTAARPGVRLARRALEGWSYEPALAGSSSSESSGAGSPSSSK